MAEDEASPASAILFPLPLIAIIVPFRFSSLSMNGDGVVTDGIAVSSMKPTPSFRLRNGSLNAVRLRRVFDMFDHNGDGEITIEELAAALERLGLGADRGNLESTVGAYIPSGAAGLRYEDFESLHRTLGDALFGAPPASDVEGNGDTEEEEEQDMMEAFKVFDENGDGFISALELQTVLGKLGMPEAKSMAKVEEMICKVDRDMDGKVNFGEFKSMMQGITVLGA